MNEAKNGSRGEESESRVDIRPRGAECEFKACGEDKAGNETHARTEKGPSYKVGKDNGQHTEEGRWKPY